MRKTLMGGTLIAAAGLIGTQCADAYSMLEWARGYEPDNKRYHALLADRYSALAVFEDDEMGDRSDARLFAEKAWNAKENEMVTPARPDDFMIGDQAVLQELKAARAMLIELRDDGGMKQAPQAAAITQVAFDCWVEQEEEGFQENDIADCRGVFYDWLQKGIAILDIDSEPDMEMVHADARARVYFPFDEATLTEQARSDLQKVAATAELFDISTLTINGHTDRAGPMDYNMALSKDRARNVHDALRNYGVETVKIDEVVIEGEGETQPAVQTGDGVRLQENRRVTISFSGSQMVDGAG